MLDVLRGYFQVASGLGDVTVAKAKEIAETVVTQGIEAGSKGQDSVQSLTDEIVDSAQTNRELLAGLVRTEVDRAVARLGFVHEDELAAVRQHVKRLEGQLHKEHQRATDRATGVVMSTAGQSTAAARTAAGVATKTVGEMSKAASKAARAASSAVGSVDEGSASPAAQPAKSAEKSETKATPQKAMAKKASAKKTTAKKSTAKKSAKKSPAKKTAVKKTSAKKSTAKKATAKKSAAKKSTSSQKSDG